MEQLLGVIIGAIIFFIIGKKKGNKKLQYGAILAGLVLVITKLFGVIGLILSILILAFVYVFIRSTKEEEKKDNNDSSNIK